MPGRRSYGQLGGNPLPLALLNTSRYWCYGSGMSILMTVSELSKAVVTKAIGGH